MSNDMVAILKCLLQGKDKTKWFKRIALVKLAEKGLVVVGQQVFLTELGRKVAEVL